MEIFSTFLSSRRKVYGGSGLRSRLSFRVRIFREARFTALPRSDLNFRSLEEGGGAFETVHRYYLYRSSFCLWKSNYPLHASPPRFTTISSFQNIIIPSFRIPSGACIFFIQIYQLARITHVPLHFSYLIIISFLSYPSATFCVEHFAKIDARYFRHVPSTGYVYKKSITANIRFLTWKRRINLSIKLQRFEISDRDKKIKRKTTRKLPSYTLTRFRARLKERWFRRGFFFSFFSFFFPDLSRTRRRVNERLKKYRGARRLVVDCCAEARLRRNTCNGV